MYDPNKPILTMTGAELKEYLTDIGLIQPKPAEVTEEKPIAKDLPVFVRGTARICQILNISQSRYFSLKKKGVFDNVIHQNTAKGTPFCNEQELTKCYNQYLHAQ